ncbi:MAG: tRNA (N6-threonylcarbamoyladenosine(37)-N6)-methyltransferase TrmO [Acutalibacteraceae bacterium]
MADLLLKTIAHIRTDFPEKFGVPRQSGIVDELEGKVIFTREFQRADFLRGIDRYSHLWLIWGFSENKETNPAATVRPPMLGGNRRVGVFASRSPFRPNPIGLSCVRLSGVEYDEKCGYFLRVFGIDMVDGTPIYDIKPYIPYADCKPNALSGFSVNPDEAKKNVVYQNGCDEILSQSEKQKLTAVLSQDPHPSYKHEADRKYYMDFSHYSVCFCADEENINVISITEKSAKS